MITFDQIFNLFSPSAPPPPSPPLPPEEGRATMTKEECHKIGDLFNGKSLWECEEKVPTPITDSIMDMADGLSGLFTKGLNYYKGLMTGGRHGSPMPAGPKDPQARLTPHSK